MWQCMPEWRTTLLTLVLLPLMINLGFWQLRRAAEKESIQQLAEQRQHMPALILNTTQVQDLGAISYRKMQLQGDWMAEFFLLDNQVQQGKVGYHVIGVMRMADGQHILVDRGWIAMPSSRQQLPDVSKPVSGIEHGAVHVPDGLSTDEPVYAETGWPRRIQRLHIPGLSREIGVALMPLMVRLDADSPSAFPTEWPVINMLPEKHIAYAIQWFGMSVALVIFYIALWIRRYGEQERSLVE